MWNIPGLPWGKLDKFLPIWMASAAQTMIVTVGLIASKIQLMPFQQAGAFNPAVNIANQKSPWAKLGKNSQKPGTAESVIVTAGLNAPAYWNGFR